MAWLESIKMRIFSEPVLCTHPSLFSIERWCTVKAKPLPRGI